ncbi:hypothetical protein BLOT_004837 [Blomia tropicalis]|nr:hypothetical protein BLOT_004837 [Blomia tropicalis]
MNFVTRRMKMNKDDRVEMLDNEEYKASLQYSPTFNRKNRRRNGGEEREKLIFINHNLSGFDIYKKNGLDKTDLRRGLFCPFVTIRQHGAH